MSTAASTSAYPIGWKFVRLEEVADVVNGSGFPEEFQGRRSLPFPFVKVSDMNAAGADCKITAAANTVDRSILAKIGAKTYPAGTVVFPKVGGALLTNKRSVLGVEAAFDNNIMGIVPKLVESDWIYLWLRSVDLASLANTQALPSIRQSVVASLHLPLPPFHQRREITQGLRTQLSLAMKARAAAEAQLEAAAKIPQICLRSIFESSESSQWNQKSLGDLAELLASKSISTDGDAEVQAVTSAALTETGFDTAGVKKARMRASDAANSIVRKHEILVSRSNTPELVGRVALYPGGPQPLVASDLTIRVWVHDPNLPAYVAAFLSYLYTKGYWRERSGGASGTMKKITRTELLSTKMPMPSPKMQESIVTSLSTQLLGARDLRRSLADQLQLLMSLPEVLLRSTFSGGI